MAQSTRNRKKTYRVRYDRIIFVLAIFIVLILILTSCITSCSKKNPGGTDSTNSITNNMSSAPDSTTSSDGTVQTPTPTEATITYATASYDAEDVHRGNLILVNAANPCQFNTDAIVGGTSTEVQLTTIKSILDTKSSPKPYTAKDWEVGLDKQAVSAMDAWLSAFYANSSNNDIRVIGGYRTDSEDLEFRTGRTCTLGIFPETGSSNIYKPEGTYAWIAENAHNYGFILRYPEGKESFFDATITDRTSATFRYVGVAAATYMAENKICLEEYLQTVKTFTIDNMLKITNGGNTYGVYYAPANANGATSFSVPAGNVPFEVSGNNSDGFVVTVTLTGGSSVPTNSAADDTSAETTAAAVQ